MNKIKLEEKTLMLYLTTDVQIGSLKATLEAQVFHSDKGTDVDFGDIVNVTYNGVPISEWRKFKEMNLSFGINYDKLIKAEFDKVFTTEAVKEIIDGIN